MATEDEIAGVYKDYLEGESDNSLLAILAGVLISENLVRKEGVILKDYSRTQLIIMIQNIDNTGKYDSGFEDLRRNISTNDSCG